jgi:large subunit ribosomal protein L25
MEEIILEVEARDGVGRVKVNEMRLAGFIPAVVYAADKPCAPLKISKSLFLKLSHQHHIENAVINLRLKDAKKQKDRPCLIKEIQYDPVHGEILHIDFHEISLTKAIKVSVPVAVKGEPVGVKQEGGSLEQVLWEIEVECLPTEIPKEISVDVSNLKMGDSIHVKDLALDSKIKILNDPDSVILSVIQPMKEEVPAAPLEGEEAVQEPEVIKEKKEVPAEEGPEEEKDKDKEKEKK